MKRHQALLLGRFQPPTIAHLSTIKTILNDWDFLTIAVMRNSPKPAWFNPKWNTYLEKTKEISYSPERNPFGSWEVKEMWDACLNALNLHQRVRSIITIRPYFDKDFNKNYPPEEIDLVRAMLEKDDMTTYDLRRQIFSELLQRKVWYVCPPFELHNTEIKKLVQPDMQKWGEFIPSGAYNVFLRIGGPERIRIASKV